jgi:hypothetical protein
MNAHVTSAPGENFMKKLPFVLAALFVALVLLTSPGWAGQQPSASSPQLTKQQEKAKADIKLGDVAGKNHAIKEAIADYKSAISADPENQDAHSKFVQTLLFPPSPPAKKQAEANRNAKKQLTREQQAALTAKENAKQKRAAAKEKKARDKRVAKAISTYDHWIKKNPREPMFYWGKAQVFEYQNNNAEARDLLHKAIAVDPSCAPAYADLSDLAAVDGDVAEQRQDAEKALALDPKDASGVFWNYALTYLTTDPVKYRQIVEDRISKYPDGLEYLLYMAAENAPSRQDEESVLEQLYKTYGPHSAHPSDNINGVMPELFNLYAETDPTKALHFAEQMQKDEAEAQAKKAAADKANDKSGATKKAEAKPAKPFWQTVADFEKSVIDAHSRIAQKKYSEAQALLAKNAIKPEGEFDPFGGIDQTPYELANAEALAGSGQTQKAYDSVKTALLPQPDDSLEAALISYGAKLGKTPAQVREDVWRTREAKAKPFAPFDLKQYVTNKDVKLADYRGRAVLVNFWFPG